MHLVAIHNWQTEEADVARTIAEVTGTLVFEARQKISAGGPAVLASFADSHQAETLANKLLNGGIPTVVIDTTVVRDRLQPFRVRRFVPGPQLLRVESFDGTFCDIDYTAIDLLLVATCSFGSAQTVTKETERKFSLGKTLLAGGVPMTKKVTKEKTVNSEERDATLRLYTSGGLQMVFNRAEMSYDGLGDAMQFTRDLNFTHLKNELRRLAPQAVYDDRLLKRASLVRLLGSTLNPETDLDLAFELLARSLRENVDPVVPLE